MAEAALHCPRCHAGMVSFQRSGVAVEQCTSCRGVFVSDTGFTHLVEGGGGAGPPHRIPSPYEGRHRRA
jgi:Zn-finger nucleic acid-binding protein